MSMIRTERLDRLLDALIEAAEWKGMNDQIGYMAGDPKAEDDKKEVSDARAALLEEIMKDV